MQDEDLKSARIARLESELRASEARLRTVVESLPFDFWMMDADGRYTLQNEASREHWGEAIGKRAEEVARDPAVLAIWQANNRRVMAGETIRGEVTLDRDGEERHFVNVLAPLVEDGVVRGLVGVNIDVTDSKRLDRETERAQRLESLGTLAGGIAHDFNNLLMAMFGNVALAKRALPAASEAGRFLEQAEHAHVDARMLTRQLLTFANGGAPVRAATDLGALFRDAARFAASGSAAKLELAIDEPLAPGHVDAGQIRQVVHNLVLNAVQAMPHGGVVRVSAAAALGPGDAPPPSRGAPCVRLRVTDEGAGIAPEILPRIFEPYFTTKEAGHGLGLSVVHAIVQRHGGTVCVESRPGAGSTFEVYLPTTHEPVPAAIRVPAEATLAPQRILLLEDEAPLRRVTAAMLSDDGHEVTGTGTVEDAVVTFERARASGRPFTLVLLDLTIPGGPGGLACLDALRALDPDVRAVVASGYSNDALLSAPERFGIRAVLEKPFTHGELAAALRRALEG